MKMRIKSLVIVVGLLAAGITAEAQVVDREWPSVVVSPILNVPMQDTAITRGPGGSYYLMGTLGTPVDKARDKVNDKDSRHQAPGAKHDELDLDFDNNTLIKIWTSKDLKNWRPIRGSDAKPADPQWRDTGVVFDIGLSHLERYDHTKVHWLRQSHKDPASPDSPVVHGVKAPELHYIKGDWYICLSINDQGTGLLKSTSGKPEGPYVPHAQITLRYGDPSMFWDQKDEFGGDDAVYWVFGGGWVARLNDDLTALAERPRLLQPQPQTAAAWTGRTRQAFPLQVGDHGAFLFKNRGKYYLTAAERTNRMNDSCDDTFVVAGDHVYGPYGQRHLMVPHGGGITVFRGPRHAAVPEYYYPQQAHFLTSPSKTARTKEEIDKAKGDETLYATFFGNDVRSIFRNRPSFLPLEWTGPERWSRFFCDVQSTPRKPQGVFTERGPWPWMKPLLGEDKVRDIKVCVAPDGMYYFSGACISEPGKMFAWRSRDLATWEKFGPLWTYEQIDWLAEKLPYRKNAFPENPTGPNDYEHIFWHTAITPWNDIYYITYCIFGPKDRGKEMRGVGALRSTSGKIEGPYESLGKVGGQVGPDPGPNLFLFHEWKDQLLVFDWIGWRNHVAVADLGAPGWKGWDWKPLDGAQYTWMQRGDCSMLEVLDDTPLFCFHSSGRLDDGERGDVNGYDVNYIVMETPWGPPRSDLQSRCIPHVGAANRFRDHNGYYWSSMFGSDHCAPWWERFGLVPLRVEKLDNGDLFIDVEDHPDDYQKRIMGGGEIAAVKTVLETIKE